jgi:hypothetical protein
MPLARDCRESTYKGISSLDCDPPQMTGPFFEKRSPPPRAGLARAVAGIDWH